VAIDDSEFPAAAVADPDATTVRAPGAAFDAGVAADLIDQHDVTRAVAIDIAIAVAHIVGLAQEDAIVVVIVIVVPVVICVRRAGGRSKPSHPSAYASAVLPGFRCARSPDRPRRRQSQMRWLNG
jgi:hypothetical protein